MDLWGLRYNVDLGQYIERDLKSESELVQKFLMELNAKRYKVWVWATPLIPERSPWLKQVYLIVLLPAQMLKM